VDEQRKRDRVRSFVLGGVIGASAAFAAVGRRRRPAQARPRPPAGGLAAFEDAPCYRELVELERFGADDA
jgi:hypothetical protein